ncbi:unnamed protein product [Mytilus coruscus]|uniref:Tyr recombinase domain-containing protein n=1 Tax=Mytilus coruscus TaxID=42192 RepID=A0A6J8DCB5_MYTCO|nr:unnamed protein product [Mytilus coruscus]
MSQRSSTSPYAAKKRLRPSAQPSKPASVSVSHQSDEVIYQRVQQRDVPPQTGSSSNNVVGQHTSSPSSKFEADLFSSAFSLAYHGFLRIGKIVRSKKWQAHQVIAIENVTLSKRDHVEIAKIVIPFSKTDQCGHGSCIGITETKLKDCPIYWLKSYLMQRPKVKGPLFCHFGGSPVTRYQFSCVLSKVLIHIGITDSVSFRTHSSRIGAALGHFEKGISEEEIKRLGRWKSNAFKGYVR